MDNKYGRWNEYINRYLLSRPSLIERTKEVLQSNTKNGHKVIDLGSGPGIGHKFLESCGYTHCQIISVDKNESLVEGVVFGNNTHRFIGQDAVKFLQSTRDKADVVLLLRSLHEILEGRMEKLEEFFNGIHKVLREDGLVIISDPMYNPSRVFNNYDINKVRKWMKEFLGHSHKPNEFIMPSQIVKAVKGKFASVELLDHYDELSEYTKRNIVTYWLVLRKC